MKKLFLFALLLVTTGLLADGVQPDGSGTEADPYQVETLDNLLWVSTTDSSWASHFIQTADIDATDTQNWNGGEGFSPIGFNDIRFTGAYNGQEHTIDGLYMNRPTLDYMGLFGKTNGATIENLGVINVNVIGQGKVGGLVGENHDDSFISACYSTGSVSGNEEVGGLVGKSRGNSTVTDCHSTVGVSGEGDVGGLVGNSFHSTINGCHSTGNVSGDYPAGGLVGRNEQSTVSDSYSTGNVSGGSHTGGLAGCNSWDSSISNCYSTGNVSGGSSVGGLVGHNYESTNIDCYATGNVSGGSKVGGLAGGHVIASIISNCYCTGNVEGDVFVGGLVGLNTNVAIINNSYCTGNVSGDDDVGGLLGFHGCSTISQCYSIGNVSGNTDVGGLVGMNEDSTVSSSFWNIETSGQATSAGGTGKTTAEMQDVATYTSLATPGLDAPWDFAGNPFDDIGNEDYWDIDGTTNSGYPFLSDAGVGIGDEEAVPAPTSAITLHPAFPNPFNPTTTIRFSVAKRQSATLQIFNLRGQLVKSYAVFAAGEHEVVWDGADNSGRGVGSGVYLYRLQSAGTQQVRKMVLLK
ncbi:MAG: T9SS type A sorting domain-containing protein [Candidatus Cloacimonetes bacterium]|nr:T9SS type A sorting domain-containing protein [Candidatus Cloacimonadota bacterium]